MHIEEGVLVGGVIGNVSILPTSAVGGLPYKAIAITIVDNDDEPTLGYQNYKFIQTEELTAGGVAIHPYGAIICDIDISASHMTGDELIVVEFDGKQYGTALGGLFEATAGDAVEFELIEDEGGGEDTPGT